MTFTLLLLTACSGGRHELFDALDLDRPDLAAVREALAHNDIAAADAALAHHLRTRSTAWTLDEIEVPAPGEEADQLIAQAERTAAGEIDLVGVPHAFPGGDIDWSANPTRDTEDVPFSRQWGNHRNRTRFWRPLASAYLLTGDLALLHDSNGALLQRHLKDGALTVVLVNNDGGGIFELLPVSRYDPPFETYFAAPQSIDYSKWCAGYGIAFERIESWEHLESSLKKKPPGGIRLIEIRTDRKADAAKRKHWFREICAELDSLFA